MQSKHVNPYRIAPTYGDLLERIITQVRLRVGVVPPGHRVMLYVRWEPHRDWQIFAYMFYEDGVYDDALGIYRADPTFYLCLAGIAHLLEQGISEERAEFLGLSWSIHALEPEYQTTCETNGGL